MIDTKDRTGELYGFAAEFKTAPDAYHAAKKVTKAGFRRWDFHTPHPIHGMDGAMGLGKSWLSAIVLVAGTTGFLFANFLQFFTQVSLYPTVVQGKPTNLFTIPAFFPVTFELTILFSGFAVLFGLLTLLLLPRWNHPLFNSELFPRSMDDRYVLVLEARDPKFKTEPTRSFLTEIGAGEIEEIYW
ncbi:MAG: DUF3341 domain-containing protein [Verrucomicrobiota bacterium]